MSMSYFRVSYPIFYLYLVLLRTYFFSAIIYIISQTLTNRLTEKIIIDQNRIGYTNHRQKFQTFNLNKKQRKLRFPKGHTDIQEFRVASLSKILEISIRNSRVNSSALPNQTYLQFTLSATPILSCCASLTVWGREKMISFCTSSGQVSVVRMSSSLSTTVWPSLSSGRKRMLDSMRCGSGTTVTSTKRKENFISDFENRKTCLKPLQDIQPSVEPYPYEVVAIMRNFSNPLLSKLT